MYTPLIHLLRFIRQLAFLFRLYSALTPSTSQIVPGIDPSTDKKNSQNIMF
jgi:hypothetical protein